MSDSGTYAEHMEEGPGRLLLAIMAILFLASYVYSGAEYGFLGLLFGWIPSAIIAIAVPAAFRYLFSFLLLGAGLLVARRSRS